MSSVTSCDRLPTKRRKCEGSHSSRDASAHVLPPPERTTVAGFDGFLETSVCGAATVAVGGLDIDGLFGRPTPTTVGAVAADGAATETAPRVLVGSTVSAGEGLRSYADCCWASAAEYSASVRRCLELKSSSPLFGGEAEEASAGGGVGVLVLDLGVEMVRQPLRAGGADPVLLYLDDIWRWINYETSPQINIFHVLVKP